MVIGAAARPRRRVQQIVMVGSHGFMQMCGYSWCLTGGVCVSVASRCVRRRGPCGYRKELVELRMRRSRALTWHIYNTNVLKGNKSSGSFITLPRRKLKRYYYLNSRGIDAFAEEAEEQTNTSREASRLSEWPIFPVIINTHVCSPRRSWRV